MIGEMATRISNTNPLLEQTKTQSLVWLKQGDTQQFCEVESTYHTKNRHDSHVQNCRSWEMTTKKINYTTIEHRIMTFEYKAAQNFCYIDTKIPQHGI